VIARMTDYEILHEYIFPQIARRENEERQRKGLPPILPDPPPGAQEEAKPFEPSRGYMLMVLRSLGMSTEQANAEYDRQKVMNDEFQKRKKQQGR
jgi:hypothetical protein